MTKLILGALVIFCSGSIALGHDSLTNDVLCSDMGGYSKRVHLGVFTDFEKNTVFASVRIDELDGTLGAPQGMAITASDRQGLQRTYEGPEFKLEAVEYDVSAPGMTLSTLVFKSGVQTVKMKCQFDIPTLM